MSGSRTRPMVPEIRFGIATGDPAAGDVHPGEFPGRVERAADQRARRSTRCSPGASARSAATRGSTRTPISYEYLGDGFQRGNMHQWGFFAQDNWRVRRTT